MKSRYLSAVLVWPALVETVLTGEFSIPAAFSAAGRPSTPVRQCRMRVSTD